MKEKNYPENLVGMTVIPTQQCDTCPDEQSACKKIILADGTHICLKATALPKRARRGCKKNESTIRNTNQNT